MCARCTWGSRIERHFVFRLAVQRLCKKQFCSRRRGSSFKEILVRRMYWRGKTRVLFTLEVDLPKAEGLPSLFLFREHVFQCPLETKLPGIFTQNTIMSAPSTNKIRRIVLTGGVAAITATGTWYGAGLKTQQERNQVRNASISILKNVTHLSSGQECHFGSNRRPTA